MFSDGEVNGELIDTDQEVRPVKDTLSKNERAMIFDLPEILPSIPRNHKTDCVTIIVIYTDFKMPENNCSFLLKDLDNNSEVRRSCRLLLKRLTEKDRKTKQVEFIA